MSIDNMTASVSADIFPMFPLERSNNNVSKSLLLSNGDISITVPDIIVKSNTDSTATCDNTTPAQNDKQESDNNNKTPDNCEIAIPAESLCPSTSKGDLASHKDAICQFLSPVSPDKHRHHHHMTASESGYNTLITPKDLLPPHHQHQHHHSSVYSLYEDKKSDNQKILLRRLTSDTSEEGTAEINHTRNEPRLLSINGHLIRDQRKISDFSLISDSSIGILVS